MDIAARLRSYDGKRVAPFRAVAEAVRDAPEVALGHLLNLATSDEMQLQVGATWVLKDLAERGTVPSGEQAAELVDLLGRAAAPDATLHVLQTLQYIDNPGGTGARAEARAAHACQVEASVPAGVGVQRPGSSGGPRSRDPGRGHSSLRPRRGKGKRRGQSAHQARKEGLLAHPSIDGRGLGARGTIDPTTTPGAAPLHANAAPCEHRRSGNAARNHKGYGAEDLTPSGF